MALDSIIKANVGLIYSVGSIIINLEKAKRGGRALGTECTERTQTLEERAEWRCKERKRERRGREKRVVLEAELVNESSKWICYQVYSNSATSEWMP